MSARYPQLQIVDHPLVTTRLAEMRDERTDMREFRAAMDVIAPLVFYEAARELPSRTSDIVTPVAPTRVEVIDQDSIVLVPILRAGMGMLVPVTSVCPHARIGTIGIRRDEATLEPSCYHIKIPEHRPGSHAFVLDPMLATGGTSCAAVEALIERGYSEIHLVSIVAAPEGVARVVAAHPQVRITAAALDERLNEVGFIVPGLGDAGDRLFGTT